MKTHNVYMFAGYCLFMFGLFYFFYWMSYNGWWVAFSAGEKATSIFSIFGGVILFGIGIKKKIANSKKEEKETKEKTKDVLNKF
jgi:putative Mn2+ efflux pump MntP